MNDTDRHTDPDTMLVESKVDELLGTHEPTTTDVTAFLDSQFDHGLAWVHFPEGCGGLGVDSSLQRVVEAKLLAAGAPVRAQQDMLGYRMGGPTVQRHGTPEQQNRYLRPAFTKRERWCQLFSEPGSGSDLASVATLAKRVGPDWVISGHKIWSSYAMTADRGMLLARTDPNAPKHRGLSFFVIDMHSPGIEVQPLRQLTGDSEFNEVFLHQVRVPDSARIGPESAGWGIAQTTLSHERGMYGSRGFERAAKGTSIAAALSAYKQAAHVDAEMRARLVRLWIDSKLLGWTNQRVSGLDTENPVPAPVAKIAFAKVQQDGFDLATELMGVGVFDDAGDAEADGRLFVEDDPRHGYLRSRANSIEGGTTEIMKNILARRTLNLPTDERNDTTAPWSELPRN